MGKKGIINGAIIKDGTISAIKLNKDSVKEMLEKLITEDKDIFEFIEGVVNKIKSE